MTQVIGVGGTAGTDTSVAHFTYNPYGFVVAASGSSAASNLIRYTGAPLRL